MNSEAGVAGLPAPAIDPGRIFFGGISGSGAAADEYLPEQGEQTRQVNG
ncbi:MAG TPA: hypothetical protein VFI27_07610 [candidate division Zixibacteria bacterium]|nr:hypothetical protein [candidate division Zixibacteria bacterium]